MDDKPLNRKEFLAKVGKACACSCVCAMAPKLDSVRAMDGTLQEEQKSEQEPVEKSRFQERMEFTEKWAVRFFDVLDANLDEPARRKLMMANGKACLLAWQKDTHQKPRTEAVTLERFAAWVKEHATGEYEINGNVILFQYLSAAETGKSSPEHKCLCPMVETNPAGLSPTYCLCSLGYVKEMHEQMFMRPVEVELVSSALRGDARCKYRITVS